MAAHCLYMYVCMYISIQFLYFVNLHSCFKKMFKDIILNVIELTEIKAYILKIKFIIIL